MFDLKLEKPNMAFHTFVVISDNARVRPEIWNTEYLGRQQSDEGDSIFFRDDGLFYQFVVSPGTFDDVIRCIVWTDESDIPDDLV